MFTSRIGIAGLLLAAGLGLSACATDGYYGGGSLGYYGDSYYDDGYYDDAYYGGYNGYGGYAPSYYGWYGDYYYPGSGIYVYDRYRRPHRWNGSQRRYWQHRGHDRDGHHGDHGDRGHHNGANWQGFDHRPTGNRGQAVQHSRGHYTRGDRAQRSREVTPNTVRATPRAAPSRASRGYSGRSSGRSGGGGHRHRQ